MIPMLLFSLGCAVLVGLAGRRDVARDPRLTTMVLGLLALFPVLPWIVPAIPGVAGSVQATAGSDGGWFRLVSWIWMAGAWLAALRLAAAVWMVRKWRQQSTLIGRFGKVELRKLENAMGPMAAGVLRPVIFVPVEWDGWTEVTKQLVLRHELAHHRRRDPLWRWLAEIACIVHACNPLVLWMTRRLRLQCEFACDAEVVGCGIEPTAYARLLCDLAESPPTGPVMAMATASTLEIRVRRMMNPHVTRGGVGLGLLIGLSISMALGFALIGSKSVSSDRLKQIDSELRWSANPFPGEE